MDKTQSRYEVIKGISEKIETLIDAKEDLKTALHKAEVELKRSEENLAFLRERTESRLKDIGQEIEMYNMAIQTIKDISSSGDATEEKKA